LLNKRRALGPTAAAKGVPLTDNTVPDDGSEYSPDRPEIYVN
jgi:hypothetical protein